MVDELETSSLCFVGQVLDQRPSTLEDFARYVSFLTPHKAELTANQQTIDYFISLFEVSPTDRRNEPFVILSFAEVIFGHFRPDTPMPGISFN